MSKESIYWSTLLSLCLCLWLSNEISPVSGDTINLIDDKIYLNVDNEQVVLQSNATVFYLQALAKVNATIINETDCYFNPLWNATVFPLTVDLWTENILNKIQKILTEQKVKLCNSSMLHDASLCSVNFTLSHHRIEMAYLESDYLHFDAMPVDLSTKPLAPAKISFAIRVPSFSSCVDFQNLFIENSFLNTIYIVFQNKSKISSDNSDNAVAPSNNQITQEITLTNEDMINAADMFGIKNITKTRFLREDYVSILSSRLSSVSLKGISLSYANIKLVRDRLFQFFCTKKHSLRDVVKQSTCKEDAFPEATESLIMGMNAILYCRLPSIAWIKSYRVDQVQTHGQYNQYGQRVAAYESRTVESSNIQIYFRIVVRQMQVNHNYRIPLSTW